MLFHAQHATASTSNSEQCRRKLHQSVIVSTATTAGYFSMVLTEQLRWSVVVLAIVRAGVNVSFVLSAHLWMYTQDPRLMQGSLEFLALLRFLESPAGSFMTWGVATSLLGVAVALALLQNSTVAVKVLTTGGILFNLLIVVVVCTCRMFLIRAIDNSLRAQQDAMIVEGSQPLPRSAGNLVLLASRKKIKTQIVTSVPQVIVFDPILLFATFSKYGEAAPLLLFGVLLGVMPPIWLMTGSMFFQTEVKYVRASRARYRT